jgi:hypothetical protein
MFTRPSKGTAANDTPSSSLLYRDRLGPTAEVLEELDFSLQDNQHFCDLITFRQEDPTFTTVYLPATQDDHCQLLIAQAGE